MNPPTSDAARLMAEAGSALRAGRYDDAEALYRRVVEMAPKNLQARFALGKAAESRGDWPGAANQFRSMLQLERTCQPALVALSSVSMFMGRFEEAEDLADRALLAEPKNPLCLKVQGRCRIERGDFLSALDSFDLVFASQPDDPQAHFARGTVLRKLHRVTEALAEFEHAAKLAPEPDALLELAEMNGFFGRFEVAAQTCTRVLLLDSRSFRANLLMAGTLSDQGQTEQAAVFWDRCESVEPTPGQTRTLKAMRAAQQGRFAEAEQDALAAMELTDSGKPYYILFSCRKATPADAPYLDRMRDLLHKSSILDSDRADLNYALGKALDDLGEYEEAMSAFNAANLVQRRVLLKDKPFDRESLRRSVDQQIAMMTKERLADTGDGPDLPIFVIGMPRSGTTLIDQILSSHTQVGSVGEQRFWLDYEKTVISYESRQFYEGTARRLKGTYEELLRALSPGSQYVVDKNPANLIVAGPLHLVFPSARIVCAQRHAVDVALSIWMTQMQTEAPFVCDKDNIVFAYKQCQRLMDHWSEVMPAERYLNVKYEELTSDSEAMTRKLLEFAGLPWEDACLHSETHQRTVSTPSFWQVRQPVYRTSVDRWKRYEPWLGPFEELINS